MHLEFEWDEWNADKLIERHRVFPDETEECFYNRHLIKRSGPNIYYLYGQTDAGRYLFVVYELKAPHIVRIYSARDMTKNERKKFRKRK